MLGRRSLGALRRRWRATRSRCVRARSYQRYHIQFVCCIYTKTYSPGLTNDIGTAKTNNAVEELTATTTAQRRQRIFAARWLRYRFSTAESNFFCKFEQNSSDWVSKSIICPPLHFPAIFRAGTHAQRSLAQIMNSNRARYFSEWISVIYLVAGWNNWLWRWRIGCLIFHDATALGGWKSPWGQWKKLFSGKSENIIVYL